MKKISLTNRLLAAVLSVVMVFSIMPSLGVAAQTGTAPTGITGAVADAPTLDSWKSAFDPVNVSTEHAGGIWTDKSILTADNLSALGISGLTVGNNNFLVALSALASNSVIMGQGSVPTDTVFVLDISGSMSTDELRSMVAATNTAIHTLLGGSGSNNRVGIVLYSDDVSTLLPLDHYTPVVDGGVTEYIELYRNGNYNYIRAARAEIVTESGGSSGGGSSWGDWFDWITGGNGGNNQTETVYLKNSADQNVTTSVATTGGTYIQGGLWQALELFEPAEGTTVSGRAPALVLMSDGAPTYTTQQFDNVPSEPSYGAGNSSTDADGFVTQLTAAYVKNQIKQWYSGTNAYLYTLGLGVDSVTDSDVAKEFLDPNGQTHSGIEALWTSYQALANSQDKTMEVNLGRSSSNNRPKVTYNADVAQMATTYVDKYFSAAQASDLAAAFQQIVNQINLQSGYYVTRLDSENANLGGYITFIDEIGSGMQVKEIKGIQIGETLYSGRVLAAALQNGLFGTAEAPTTLGDNLIWSLKERLDVTDTQTVRELLEAAYRKGQISYDSTTGDFSNYIGWYSDANGDFLAFWDAENPDAEVPVGAAFANKCYGMLGSTTTDQTIHASDMMYIAIQVSKKVTDGKVLDKTPEQVTFRIPVSLLPVVTYQIELDSQNVDTATRATVTYNAADPIRLLYEVGVHEKLNAINIHEFLREGYWAKDKNTGHYYLYTNAWNWEGAGAPGTDWTDESNQPQKNNAVGNAVLADTAKNAIAYACFEPGADNEHYYFTKNTQIYVKDGETYTALTAAPTNANGDYYFKHTVYTNAEADGIESHYGKLSQAAVQAAMDANAAYVPKNTLHHYEQTHTHDLDKDNPDTESVNENYTQSFYAVRHHLVGAKVNGSDTTEHVYELVYMGNNGRVTYAPAQGIAISKTMADGSAPDVEFTFDVTLTAPLGLTLAGQYTTYNPETDTYGTVNVDTNGKAVVAVKPGQTIYIVGLPTGTTYGVTERRSDGYLQSDAATGASGAVAANQVSEAVFINRVRGVGSLNVFKTVTYNKGAAQTDAAKDKKFTVTVTVKDGDILWNGTAKVDNVDTSAVNGVITFEIADGQTVSITNLPEGYTYQVAEDTDNLPDGYAYVDGVHLQGTITTAASSAALRNSYTPNGITISDEITLKISKILNDAAGNPIDSWQSDFKFEFQLLRYENGGWVDQQANIEEITAKGQTVSVSLAGQTFNAVDAYLFRVSEKSGTRLGMAYDTTDHDFRVYVTDTNLDGKLEISEVEIIDPLETIMIKDGSADADNDGKWIIGAEFTNVYQMNSANWTPSTAKKTLNGREMKDGEFSFTLYRLDGSVRTKIATVSCGKAGDIHFPAQVFTQAGTYTYIVVEDVPADAVNNQKNGVTYDRSEYQVAVTVAEGGSGSSGQLAVTNVTRTKIKNAAGEATGETVTQVTFTNEYKASAVTQSISGNKLLTNLTPGAMNPDMTAGILAGDYSFVLKMVGGQFKQADSTAPDGYVWMDEGRISVKAGGSFSHSGLYFDKADTYVFTLTEADVTKPGVTKDSSEYRITVVVEDNGVGSLAVTSVSYTKNNIPVEKITFHNTYEAEATAPLVLSGNKQLQYRPANYPLRAGEFGFVLKDSTGKVIETVRNDANGDFGFAGLTFDRVGTYIYTITELHGGETIQGVAYDPAQYTVTVTVADNGSGKLIATPTYTKGGENVTAIAFRNTYAAQPVKVQLTGRKNLVGRPENLKANEFSFTLTGPFVTGGSETVKNDTNGLITFSELTFTTEGVWQYTITENVPQTDKVPGVTYDETVHQVTITVTDNGKGQLVANVSIPNQDVEDVDFRFFNSYKAGKTDPVVLGGNKTLTGRPVALKDGEFSFLLKDKAGNLLQTVTNDGSSFAFTGLVFDAVGVYEYTIAEEHGGEKINGVTHDSRVYTVTVTVVDDSTGKLKAQSIVYTAGGETAAQANFVNTYQAEKVTNVVIEAGKVLTDITAGGNVNLTVTDGDFSFNLKGENVDKTAQNVGGKVTFPGLEYEQAGTYRYTITEVKGNKGGITYDATTYNVTVTVTDPGDGQLVAKVEYKKGEQTLQPDEVVFRNTYAAQPVKVQLTGRKNLVGRPENLKANEFSFTLAGSFVANGSETVKNDANGLITFSQVTFNSEGIYTATITEHVPQTDKVPGVTYDETVHQVTITVTDNGKGQLVANVSIPNQDVEDVDFRFFNSYKAGKTDPVVLGGNKTLTGRPVALKDGEFSFLLKDKTGNLLQTVTNDGGSFAFTGLVFDAVGVYEYTIAEEHGGEKINGVTYDNRVYTVTVTVVDDSTGKLKAQSIVYTAGGVTAAQANFVNTYQAEKVTNVVIEAGKVLTDITAGGNVTLTVTDGDFSFNLKGENVDKTAQNVGGKVTFPGLEYEQAGTYHYTITEVKGNKGGITYDATTYNVTVTVTDPGDGQLVAKVEYKKGEQTLQPDEVVFRNTFKAENAQLTLTGKKTLTGGRVLKEGEFSFVLKDSTGKVIETVKNAANGAFAFETLTFDQVGTYQYTISEIAGSDSLIKYDDTVYKITVTVTYENGKLSAVATVDGSPAGEFGYTNIFTPAAVSVNITAEKKVTNNTAKVMGLDGFTFLLTDGKKEITAVSGADGLAKFNLEFTAADIGKTFTYKLSEVKGDIADMTYDETVYEITVTVSQDTTSGELKVAVSRAENAVFTNVYGTYEEPPKTDDSFRLTLWSAMLSVSALAMLAVLVIGKQKLQMQ